MTARRYPRETKELIPITVTADGISIVAGVEFSKTLGAARPTVWTAAVVDQDDPTVIGIWIEGWLPGVYTLYSRVTDSPSVPVHRVTDQVIIE